VTPPGQTLPDRSLPDRSRPDRSLPGQTLPGSRHVVVVGGGIAGLAAAWELVTARRAPGEAPVRVTVLEQSERVGGKLAVTELSGVSGPVAVDAGAESMLARRPEGVGLAREVGLADDLVSPATADARVYSAGRLHRLPTGTVLGVPTDPAALGADGLFSPAELQRVVEDTTAGPDPLMTAVAAGGDVAVGELVAARMGDAVVDRLVEPLLGGVYAGHARELSLRLTSPALADAVRGATSLLAAAAAVSGRSRVAAAGGPVGGDGGAAPSGPGQAVSLAGTGTGTPVFAGLRAGMGRLPIAVAQALRDRGATIREQVTVRELTRTADGWQLVCGPVPLPVLVAADAVVLAVPAVSATRLLRTAGLGAAADGLAGIQTASVALVHLAVPAGLGAGFTGSGVLVPPVEGLVVKAATWSSSKWGWQATAAPDTTVLRASVGRHREEAELQRTDEDLVDLVVADLTRISGVALSHRDLLDSRVVRWGGGLPQYAVGHADRIGAVRASLVGQPGLAMCGAAYDGVGVPACIASGRAAARAVLEWTP